MIADNLTVVEIKTLLSRVDSTLLILWTTHKNMQNMVRNKMIYLHMTFLDLHATEYICMLSGKETKQFHPILRAFYGWHDIMGHERVLCQCTSQKQYTKFSFRLNPNVCSSLVEVISIFETRIHISLIQEKKRDAPNNQFNFREII